MYAINFMSLKKPLPGPSDLLSLDGDTGHNCFRNSPPIILEILFGSPVLGRVHPLVVSAIHQRMPGK